MTFTLCQTMAAVIAGSEAMMGDSAAMFVDALTYLFNLVAERKKNHFDETWQGTSEQDPERARRIRQRDKRKMTLTMELIPPLVSVTTLIVVTIFVLRKAIRVLILDVHRDRSQQGDPNIKLMLFFSTLNLGLDFLNVFCFARAKHLMGYETVEGHLPSQRGESYDALSANDLELNDEHQLNGNGVGLHSNEEQMEQIENHGANYVMNENGNGRVLADPPGRKIAVSHQSSTASHLDSSFSSEEDEKDGANLNMCSAYTVSPFWPSYSQVSPKCTHCPLTIVWSQHVFADTLRSIAVIIAGVLAEVVDGVTPEEADATAAVVVSGLILLSLLPLFHGLKHTYAELKAIRAEESSENMFPEQQVELV